MANAWIYGPDNGGGNGGKERWNINPLPPYKAHTLATGTPTPVNGQVSMTFENTYVTKAASSS